MGYFVVEILRIATTLSHVISTLAATATAILAPVRVIVADCMLSTGFTRAVVTILAHVIT